MVHQKNAKTTALAAVLIILTLCTFSVSASSVGISAYHASMFQRIVYPFFHAGIIHALMNVWVFLCIVFYYNTPLWKILAAYIIAVTFPITTLYSMFGVEYLSDYTVGLSGVCFALAGSISFNVQRKLYWQFCMAATIGFGFFFPCVNAVLHLYCYIVGLLIGILDMPIKR